MAELSQLCCPCLGALAIVVLVYFVWALCRVAAMGDAGMAGPP